MKLLILAIFCSIAALTWGESDVKDASSLIKANSALNDVKDVSSLNKGNSALNNEEDAWRLKNVASIIFQGYEIGFGAGIYSQNNRFRLIMQDDGNLVLYKIPENRPIWASNTNGQGGVRAVMQYDGNFVVYTANNVPRWASRTEGRGANYLVLQDDGNLVIYSIGYNLVHWASNTNGKKATNLRTESLNSTSVVNGGATITQQALPDTLLGPVHFDKDPISAGDAPDQGSNRTLNGIN